MERSNRHGPRIDEELDKEVQSLVTGSPVEARAEPARMKKDAADREPEPEALVGGTAADDAHAPAGSLPHDEARARSELATYLRPSIFPASRETVIRCAIEDHAPDDMVELLGSLPAATFANVAEVWEALGGHREWRDPERESRREAAGEPAAGPEPDVARRRTEPVEARTRPEPDVPPVDAAVHAPADSPRAATAPDTAPPSAASEPGAHRFGFRFDWRYRLAGKPLHIDEEHAYVEIDDERLRARFGPWMVETPLDNVAGATPTGPYSMVKTIGPAHVSLSDRGLTFATNRDEGVCIRFREPVKGLDPLGVVRHPALTVTVDDVDALVASLPAGD